MGTTRKIETIRTPGGKRLYNVEKYILNNNNKLTIELKIKKNICYCRVSTYGQKDDLKRQITYMKDKYPEYEIISDIASGLCGFGYDLIEYIINEYSNGKIIILNKHGSSIDEELTTDLVSIINVFSAKLNGIRTYKNKDKNKDKNKK